MYIHFRNWKKQLCKKQPSFLMAFLRTFPYEIFISALNLSLQTFLLVIRPILIGWILYELQDLKNPAMLKPIVLHTTALILLSIVFVLIRNEYYWFTYLFGNRLRIATNSLIYDKMLKMNQKGLGGTSSGFILTLLTSDMARLDQAFIYLHYFWIGILQIFAIFALAIITNGSAAVLSVMCVLLFMILQAVIGREYGKVKLTVAEATDERLKRLNDLIAGIRAIKMYCWENFFYDWIKEARQVELGQMLIARILQVFQISMTVYLPKIGIWLIYLTVLYIWPTEDKSALTSYRIFTCYGLLQSLYMNVTLFVPLSIQHNYDTLISCQRIQKYLTLLQLEDEESNPIIKESEIPLIDVFNASARWIQVHLLISPN
ncbi:Multidrug resistance-associated protein 4 [Cichlidogyrus casuarinus]|uniref:Multidrug resistance-associated protein 4 n=1 Tax=Cichlidogyrus casuarinus TaxID=1844966 RepID=A0ABD2QFW7_9PLAT